MGKHKPIGFYPVPIDSSIKESLDKLPNSVVRIIAEDMSTALKNRVIVMAHVVGV
jgi:hypothetical protein